MASPPWVGGQVTVNGQPFKRPRTRGDYRPGPPKPIPCNLGGPSRPPAPVPRPPRTSRGGQPLGGCRRWFNAVGRWRSSSSGRCALGGGGFACRRRWGVTTSSCFTDRRHKTWTAAHNLVGDWATHRYLRTRRRMACLMKTNETYRRGASSTARPGRAGLWRGVAAWVTWRIRRFRWLRSGGGGRAGFGSQQPWRGVGRQPACAACNVPHSRSDVDGRGAAWVWGEDPDGSAFPDEVLSP